MGGSPGSGGVIAVGGAAREWCAASSDGSLGVSGAAAGKFAGITDRRVAVVGGSSGTATASGSGDSAREGIGEVAEAGGSAGLRRTAEPVAASPGSP
ncbi:hypothetical protein [Sinosporangium album]|uniref:hypothetical protein n=1 Tax=Sinosporangium album TaxID=504805 RepID=UPI00115FBA11|nr:hypothetical protein [Sinosporangium album]